jgi:Enoyl-CoA hydratase/carnithine racemase
LNAVDAAGHRELAYVWRDLEGRKDVRAVLVRGEGEAFSAGGDFSLVASMREDWRTQARVWKEARDLVYNLLDFPRPVVAAIHGVAVGAGLAVALLADVPIAAKNARILDGHTRLGVAAGDHAVLIWPLLVGMAKAKYHLLLNEPLSGEEAERLGMVALAVEEEELLPRARAVARRLAKGSPTALAWTKYALNQWLRAAGPVFDTSLALEFLGFAGPDLGEGLASFREKRPPSFDEEPPF